MNSNWLKWRDDYEKDNINYFTMWSYGFRNYWMWKG